MFLRQLNNHDQRLNRLRDWEYFYSREYEELVWKVDAERIEAGPGSPVVRFEKRFRKRFRDYGIPVFCNQMFGDYVEMLHCQWLDRLSLGELNIYLWLGGEAAQGASVRCGDRPQTSYQWEVEPVGKEAVPSVYPWRYATREEVNDRCDSAVAGAQRIVALREERDRVDFELRNEMDRLRRERGR